MQQETLKQGFWDDSDKAQEIFDELNSIKADVENYDEIEEKIEEVKMMLEISKEDNTEEYEKEISKTLKSLEEKVDEFKIKTLLVGEYDKNNAIMSIHAGAGGTEAQDWAEMLLRMYTRWIADKNYSYKITDYNQDTEGGIKSVSLIVQGINAYGFLKSEKGVHRLVRISPFDQQKRRHTSFASVDVFPEIKDNHDIQIDDKDLKVDTYRASGAGGQHVNMTDSAVRITHPNRSHSPMSNRKIANRQQKIRHGYAYRQAYNDKRRRKA